MATVIIYSIKEGLLDGLEALSETLRSSGLNTDCAALEDLEFIMFDCQAYDVTSIETVYFLTNDPTVETLTRMFRRRNKAVVNAEHLLCRFSKLTVQYLLFENGLPIPKNYFSPASMSVGLATDPLVFPVIVKSHRHRERRVVLANQNDYKKARENVDALSPCYLEEFLGDDHVAFKSYVVGADVFYDVAGQPYASAALNCQLQRIGRICSLEAYSIDCLASYSTGHIYFIDVNPAPAFMGSVEARVRLAEYLRSLGGSSNGK